MTRAPVPFSCVTVQGRLFLVDDADLQHVQAHRWYVRDDGRGHFYMVRSAWPAKGLIPFHRELLGLHQGDGKIGDHVNGDTTDNRRSNLRVVDRSQNASNCRLPAGGVSKHYRRFKARITSRGRVVFYEVFHTREQAEEARKAASLRLLGDHASYEHRSVA